MKHILDSIYLLLTELSRSVWEDLDRGREVQTERRCLLYDQTRNLQLV